jgi:flagellar biosynthesis/type III secretory pathway protein FliH
MGVEEKELLKVADLEEVESMLNNSPNWAQRMENKGRQEGRKEGRQEGRQEGQIKLLSSQLAEKFGSELAARFAEERLLNASSQQIDSWARRILRANTIDEVFEN